MVENKLKQEYDEAADHHFSKHKIVINASLIFEDKSRMVVDTYPADGRIYLHYLWHKKWAHTMLSYDPSTNESSRIELPQDFSL